MKKLVVVWLLLVLHACDGDTGPAPPPSLESLRGQWVLINYWAQWCKPCIEEIPELNELDAIRDDVTVLGVNFDNAQGDELKKQEAQLGIKFTNLAQDPSAQLGAARPVALPTTLIVNPDGKLVATLLGPQTLESLSDAMAGGTTSP